MNAYEQYMIELAQPMRTELTGQGFESLETTDAVKDYMDNAKHDETTFIVVNSVCGCAAGLARPAAVTVAQQNEKKPSRTATVFAGQDKEATETMREYIAQVPSSPSMALFKGSELKYFMPREHIEGRDIQEICMDIKDAFDEYCD
ncbi:bacilliredoxin BrxA [Mammaliicoccus vitulinus]|uniref:bacilliredoxin BrxA n=1 Tax=Mammaliicoccus vitulinus TaxID=71237 RepID=UPI00248CB6CC|nr:bacilliredoxin BrxA [Mammaliicoccus vitulinus]